MNAQQGYDVEDLSVAMSACYGKTVTNADIVLFAGASGRHRQHHGHRDVSGPAKNPCCFANRVPCG